MSIRINPPYDVNSREKHNMSGVCVFCCQIVLAILNESVFRVKHSKGAALYWSDVSFTVLSPQESNTCITVLSSVRQHTGVVVLADKFMIMNDTHSKHEVFAFIWRLFIILCCHCTCIQYLLYESHLQKHLFFIIHSKNKVSWCHRRTFLSQWFHLYDSKNLVMRKS